MSYTHDSVTECVCVLTSGLHQLNGTCSIAVFLKCLDPCSLVLYRWTLPEHNSHPSCICCVFLLQDWKYSYHSLSIKKNKINTPCVLMNHQTSSLIRNITWRIQMGPPSRSKGSFAIKGPYLYFLFWVINYFCTVFCIYFSCSIVLGNNATLSECSVKPYMCMYKAYIYLYVSLLLKSYSFSYSVLFL